MREFIRLWHESRGTLIRIIITSAVVTALLGWLVDGHLNWW